MAQPNGIAATSDERHLLVSKSLSVRLLRIDLQNPCKPEVACQFAIGSIPDGMEWLTDGRLAIAQHGRGCITLMDTRNGAQSEIKLPGGHPTNLIQDEDYLYVTEDTAEGVLKVRLT